MDAKMLAAQIAKRAHLLRSLLISAAVLIYPAYKLATLAPTGFCAAQNRYFTDDEFISIAIRDQVRYKKINIDGSEPSIQQFHSIHPNCCTVGRKSNASIMERLTDFQEVVVHLKYEIRREQIEINRYYEAWVVLGTCGRLIKSYGTTIEKM